ncbi:NUDIX hydrolase [Mycolicibacterium duvalii]|uniref:Coenzyme A pyrophosphatase n=1 Tax=Mycolicibacterium duvalii TaxID=39688 RepID=A0A7I7K8X1_9MYCO|nr:CoA pyrophosphatase [Mycolicibacterium duvalii]BBX19951.1 coenzyme A pyrophosphatase [Mycolicibacterium duvalii]
MSWDFQPEGAPGELVPDTSPAWLTPLVDRPEAVRHAYRRRVPAEVMAAVTAANATAAVTGARRDAAVLVLFSGPPDGTAGRLPENADLLVTVRASTLRHHAGQAAFPGGAADPGDRSPVHTALREATEETGVDATRLRPLATLEKMFIPPSGFHVVPVLAYSPDPGPVAVVDRSETALVSRVPVRAFTNPENRIMVYRRGSTRRAAGPAFLLNQMVVWGFTGHVISAMLDVAGWSTDWDTDNVYELDEAMRLLDTDDSYGEAQR